MPSLPSMPPFDLVVFVFFVLCWLFYEPLFKRLARGSLLNSDMTVIRGAWMGQMSSREIRLLDANLLGHALNSASFFASSNLLLIAAAAGALFGGESTFRSVSSLEVIKTSSRWLFEGQLALVMLVLSRGLLDFIWAIRQMNYSLAIMGATPEGENVDPGTQAAYAAAATRVLNPALSSFNRGVRGYYFALAAAAWLFGPIAFTAATLGAIVLLVWRQRHSPAAKAIRDLRRQIDTGSVDP
ncbi:DUF599 family protein [Caulobacter mirabilis]|nr:DUF599 family protein [Caulobacter mirabilis]